MHPPQNLPQPPDTWQPGLIATAVVAAVLGIGIVLGESSIQRTDHASAPLPAPRQDSGSPAGAPSRAVVDDPVLPLSYVREPSGSWTFLRRSDGQK